MRISNNFTIYHHKTNSCTAYPIRDNRVATDSDNLLPNIYYTPIFTSKKSEMSDSEFQQRRDKLIFGLSDIYNSDFLDLPSVYFGLDSIITKSNLKLAEEMYPIIKDDSNNIKYYIEILENVNEDNMEFARKYFLHQTNNYLIYLSPDTLKYVNEDNEELVIKVYEKIEQFTFDTGRAILKKATKENCPLINELLNMDKSLPDIYSLLSCATDAEEYVRVLPKICLDLMAFNDEKPEFPDNIADKLPIKMDENDVKLIKSIYGLDNDILIEKIFSAINSENIEIGRFIFNNFDEIMNKYPQYRDVGFFYQLIMYSNNGNVDFIKDLIREAKTDYYQTEDLARFTKDNQEIIPPLKELLSSPNCTPDSIISTLKTDNESYNIPYSATVYRLCCDKKSCDKKLKHQKELMLKNPDKYITGPSDPKSISRYVNMYFNKDSREYRILTILADIFDAESLDVIFRKRENNLLEYIKTCTNMTYDTLTLLKQGVNCKNENGKPLTSAQKIELFEILGEGEFTNYPVDKIKSEINTGILNLEKIKTDMVKGILYNIEPASKNLSDKELLLWDPTYILQLAKTYKYTTPKIKNYIENLAQPENSGEGFKDYIQNRAPDFARINQANKMLFEKLGLDYEVWLNPPSDCKIQFVSNSINSVQLKDFAEQLEMQIEILRSTNAKRYIDKQLINWIENDKFVVPQAAYRNKVNFIQFINGLDQQLNRVWQRAEHNVNNKDLSDNAKNTLSVREKINTIRNSVGLLSSKADEKPFDLTIKMWDRIPYKDIFQGNYSDCCIGMSKTNDSAMLTYLYNTGFNMIELVDNGSGKPIGNALCYFVEDSNGNPQFVIDNIELNPREKSTYTSTIRLRDAILEYGAAYSSKVAGQNIQVLLGGINNDLPLDYLYGRTNNCKFVGKSEDKIYLDAFGGWQAPEDLDNYKTELFYYQG